MLINKIVDKVIREADIDEDEYTVEDRLVDIHQTRLELHNQAMQVTPATNKEYAQSETLVAGDQTFVKDRKHSDIVKVEYRINSDDEWYCLDKRKDCIGNKCVNSIGKMQYSEDYASLYMWDAEVGELRVTYFDNDITEWVEADYTTGTATPDELPEVYHALLWLTQVVRHAGYYSKERYEQINIEYNRLYQAYQDHLYRDVELDMQFVADDEGKSNL